MESRSMGSVLSWLVLWFLPDFPQRQSVTWELSDEVNSFLPTPLLAVVFTSTEGYLGKTAPRNH